MHALIHWVYTIRQAAVGLAMGRILSTSPLQSLAEPGMAWPMPVLLCSAQLAGSAILQPAGLRHVCPTPV